MMTPILDVEGNCPACRNHSLHRFANGFIMCLHKDCPDKGAAHKLLHNLPWSVLQATLDIAVNSMDFGSGFLDDEDVAALRTVAAVLGVDPMKGTPDNFVCKYRGHHAGEPYLDSSMFISFADGYWRNAYNALDPEGRVIRGPDGGLVKTIGRIIRMRCPDCGHRWDAFEEPPPIAPLEKGRLGSSGSPAEKPDEHQAIGRPGSRMSREA